MRATCIRFALVAMLAIAACNSNSQPPMEQSHIDAATGYVDTYYQGASQRPDHILYKYPDVVEPGDEIYDFVTEKTVEVTEPSFVFWFDPHPTQRFQHPSFLLLVPVDGAANVSAERFDGWPVIDGGMRWGTYDLNIPMDHVVVDQGGVHQARLNITERVEEGVFRPDIVPIYLTQSECLPAQRKMLLVLGPGGPQAADMNAEAARVQAFFSRAALGYAVTTYRTQKGDEANADALIANANKAIKDFLATLRCCDEGFIYYIGHGYGDKANEYNSGINGSWILGSVGNKGKLMTGAAVGTMVKDALNNGNGSKLFVFSNSCHSGGFTNGLMGTAGTTGTDNKLDRGNVTSVHGSQPDQLTDGAAVGDSIMNALDPLADNADGTLTHEQIKNAVVGAVNGFTKTHGSANDDDLDQFNQSGSTSNQGTDLRSCPECGDGVVDGDEGEECDPPGGAVDDGDACTTNDTCNSECKLVVTPVSCDTPPECHTGVGATCNSTTGDCTYPTAASGTACADDGDPCTSDECDESGNCVHLLIDNDSDGICDNNDNCSNVYNPGQIDCDSNMIGDACQSATDTKTDPVNDLILPGLGGAPAGVVIPELDITGVQVDVNPIPNTIDVTLTLGGNVLTSSPHFTSYDLIVTGAGGDPQAGLFQNGLIDIGFDTQGGTLTCKVYMYDPATGWQEPPAAPGFACGSALNTITFTIPVQDGAACGYGLRAITQELNGNYLADWGPEWANVPGFSEVAGL